VSSGTAALHLCVRALGISEGDEVIMPSFTFIAVANAVRYEKAIPVFVDIEKRTLNIDPDKIEAAITPRTRAIIVVHTFGCPADLDRIVEIAHRNNLRVIEDACEAIGAEYGQRKVGTFGDAAAFAFYPNKQMTTGEGGAIATDSAELADRIRRLRNQGRDGSGDWIQHTELGYNYRISEINCALGVEQLRRIDSILEQRSWVARRYDELLRDTLGLIRPPLSIAGRKISWFVYVVQLSEGNDASRRDWIHEEMNARGIGVGRYFAPIHFQPIYRRFGSPFEDLPVTESIAIRSIALPFFNRIRHEEIFEVSSTLASLIAR
jgi:perosamine synthetase